MTTFKHTHSAVVAAVLALSLVACGSSDTASQAANGEAGPAAVPQVDTGWTVGTDDNGAFQLKRQLNQLTLAYSLAPGSNGPRATVRASVFPCMNGEGNEMAEESFTPIDDESGQIMTVRDRIDSVVGKVAAKCRIPDEVRTNITAGFDGKYFSTDSQRAAISGS
ncbi:hypothetical protein K3165_02150 [Qipengyuania sp. 1XM1-15A]|uniref:hypothetical protein n=1 Tax=Qipengyuania xiamenensis TaxID=2867237 RepID=UPI001C8700A5|nr:hypothetical protein [Qipengyuania xiamenensis]MBX7531722.1 hypothetical protein [Qipengyuania xiamenensis]